MRIEAGDPRGRDNCRVYLNGVLMKTGELLVADDERGEIVRHVRDNTGSIVYDWQTGNLKTETLTGRVVIKLGPYK